MINNSYSADVMISRDSDGYYDMDCYFSSGGSNIHVDYLGDDFTEGLNSLINDIEKQLLPKKEEKNLEEQIAALKIENERLKNSLEAFTTIENNFNKKDENKTEEQPYTHQDLADDYNKIMEKINKQTKNLSAEEYVDYLFDLLGLK